MKSFTKLILTFLFILSFVKSSDAQMFWNQAAVFAGSSTSYIRTANSSELNITGSFTLEAWIKPQSTLLAKGIFGKGSTLGTSMEYGMRLSTTGRISIITNGSSKLISRSDNPVPLGEWTHVCGTYNSTTGEFKIYFNSILDTSSIVAGAAPPSNTDSLFIGITGSSTPYKGVIDEARIWNRALSSNEITRFYRTSLGTSSGKYEGLVLSITCQQNEASGAVFTLFDWSGNSNFGIGRNVTDTSLSNSPSETIALNDCMELDGTGDYAAAADDLELSPTEQLTMSCWVYPRSTNNSVLIHKGSPTGAINTNYRLGFLNRRLFAGINGNFAFTSNDTIPLNRWSHVTFAYYAPSGSYYFYTNGRLTTFGAINAGAIVDGADSLYIGGTPSLTKLNGYIDEVKIIKDVKFEETIAQTMYRSSEQSLGDANATYNLDGYSHSSFDNAPQLFFRDDAGFAHSGSNNQPVSPMNRSDVSAFEGGFHLKPAARRIPETGLSGNMIDDTLQVFLNETITDIDVFVALNHNLEQDLEIYLVGPGGGQVLLTDRKFLVLNSDNMVTIFDDQSPTPLQDFKYTQFSPRIQPENPINQLFAGGNTEGSWRLRINDATNSNLADTGWLYGWGVRFNNRTTKPYIVQSKQFIQGFYRSASNSMVSDTMRFYFRNTASPYAIVDSALSYLPTTGVATLYPTSIFSGAFYFMQLKHRNSIETWSNVISLNPFTFQLDYDFSNSTSKAYGSNQILIDNLPLRYGIYSGDVNQSGDVDGTDLARIDNDAFNFNSGYISTDITGDGFTDATDYSLADNNATNFVSAITPGPEPLDQTESNIGSKITLQSNVDPSASPDEAPFVRTETFEELQYQR